MVEYSQSGPVNLRTLHFQFCAALYLLPNYNLLGAITTAGECKGVAAVKRLPAFH